MTREQLRERVRALILPELKAGNLNWYYISVADETTFHAGFVIRAFGPVDAWRLLHTIYLVPKDAETLTNGPIPPSVMENIPEEQRWRPLTRDEAINLGK